MRSENDAQLPVEHEDLRWLLRSLARRPATNSAERFEESDRAFTGKQNTQLDWIPEKFKKGTTVWMKLSNKSTRQPKDVYDKFTGDFAFNKTTVPVKLAQVGSSLVSRSQAKRILARFEQFRTVQLDFSGVEWVGQAFADEIFRVYKNAHPDVQIEVVNANEDIGKMIQGAKA